MYKLLIAEDEDLIRSAIMYAIDWQGLGFDVAQAEDGEVALEIARSFCPDIVLTDIRMPFIDGLELTQKLKELFPNVIVVILSGHDEFAYAQEAVSLGVKEYIKKPIKPGELVEVMQRMAKEVDVYRTKLLQTEKLKKQVRQSLPLLRDKLLNQIIAGTLPQFEIQDMLDFAQLQLRGQSYTVCVMEYEFDPPVSGRDAALLSFAVANIVDEELGTDGVSFEDRPGSRVFIYCGRTKEREENYIRQIVESICESLYSLEDIVPTSAIGITVRTLGEASISYQSACDALQQRLLQGKGNIYDACQVPEEQSYYPLEQSKNLLATLKLESQEKFLRELDDFFDGLRNIGGLSMENLLTVMLDLVNCGQRLLLEAGTAFELPSDEIYKRLFALSTLEEYKSAIKEYLVLVRQALVRARTSKSSVLIEKVCAFINQNYCDSSLSLNSVASHVFLSPTYLSILFKKELGSTFIEYVTSLRMEKAKELLKVGLKTYETADKTGYNDPQYFSSCFKKYTGLTPSEYKNCADR